MPKETKLKPKESSTHSYTPVRDEYYVRRAKNSNMDIDIDAEAMVPIRGTEKAKYRGIPIDPLKAKAKYKMPRTANAERLNQLEEEGN